MTIKNIVKKILSRKTFVIVVTILSIMLAASDATILFKKGDIKNGMTNICVIAWVVCWMLATLENLKLIDLLEFGDRLIAKLSTIVTMQKVTIESALSCLRSEQTDNKKDTPAESDVIDVE